MIRRILIGVAAALVLGTATSVSAQSVGRVSAGASMALDLLKTVP